MTKGDLTPQAQTKESRNNNFAFIRIVAASAVFMGHTGVVLGVDSPYVAGIAMHELGVIMLFFIGGYLITKAGFQTRILQGTPYAVFSGCGPRWQCLCF